VLGLHVLINRSIRKVAASAFYRKKPAVANVTLLVRECGLVALTQGFVALRALRLVATTFFYVGRLDSPFLYDSVGQVGGLRIDREPYMFQIDILQHEAHRHPYIETLGVMYLLKLRHRDSFCTFAGSSWRLIFVYVLMPWLSKYRALRRPQPELNLDAEDGSGDAPPLPPPLRAVTLVDPQAYALRAVSLVPVASGWTGGSTKTFGGRKLSVMSETLSLLQDDEDEDVELHELREENQKLRMQLRLKELSPANTALSRDARSPAASPEISIHRKAKSTNNPGFEVDSRGRIIDRGQGPPLPSPELKKGNRLASIDESPLPSRPGMKREESEGLFMLRPPKQRTTMDDGP